MAEAIIIQDKTKASVVRKSIENRAQLENKGDIYIGTGNKIEEGSTIPDTKGQNIIDAINDNQTNEKYVQLKDENNLKTYLLAYIYPVGSIKMTADNINPSTYLGGTWVAWGAGKVPVGVDTTDTDFATVEKTGGEKEHILTTNEMPSHGHTTMYDYYGSTYLNGGLVKMSGTPSFETKKSSNCYIVSRSGADLTDYYVAMTGSSGSSRGHNNLQPYITCYMWKRTA